MTCKELIEYLETFNSDEAVSFVVANPKSRLLHKINKCMMIDEMPAILLETFESEDVDGVPFDEKGVEINGN